MTPLVSIVIPHFNRSALLAETLASVRAQSHDAWEVIVVDDGSAEEEWQAVQRFRDDRVAVIRRSDGPKGPSRCRNLGSAAARGEYVIFLDSDDLLAPWCLERRLAAVAAEPGHDLWVFPVMLFEQSPADTPLCWNRLAGEGDLERFLRSDPPWHTSSPLWRREAFMRTGGFNEAVMYGDDADLHVRALLGGLRYRKYPEMLPDLFIRRSGEARITNSLDSALRRSRLTRLAEGSRALAEAGAGEALVRIWEGQYFVEGEFLLFNCNESAAWIGEVLAVWRSACHPSPLRNFIVSTYFQVALATRQRLYLALRLARRLAMLLLPRDYFPTGGGFHSHRLDPEALENLRRVLSRKAPEAAL